MPKIADDELAAITLELLTGEKEVLTFLCDLLKRFKSRYYELAIGSMNGNLMFKFGNDSKELGHGSIDESPISMEHKYAGQRQESHLEALDKLGFLIYAKRPDTRGGGTTLPDSVTILPAAVLWYKHDKRKWFVKRGRVLWLQFRKAWPYLFSGIALILSIVAIIVDLSG